MMIPLLGTKILVVGLVVLRVMCCIVVAATVFDYFVAFKSIVGKLLTMFSTNFYYDFDVLILIL
jgi:hypothetical protein